MSSSNNDWAWLWWTVIVIINAINLIVCAILYIRSLDRSGEGGFNAK